MIARWPINTPVLAGGTFTPSWQRWLSDLVAKLNAAPLVLQNAALLDVPVLGALEYVDDGTNGHLYFTRNVAGVPTRTEITIP